MADYYSLGVILFEMATGAEPESVRSRNYFYPGNIDPDLRDVIERVSIDTLELELSKSFRSLVLSI